MKNESVEVLRHDLKALLFWASVGVASSKGGAYQSVRGGNDSIENILVSYAEFLKFPLPNGGNFRK